MIRTVRLYEVPNETGNPLRILVELYNSSNQYPTDFIKFDLNKHELQPNSKVLDLPKVYIDQFIYGVLGRDGDLVGDYLAQRFNEDVPKYDLSTYELDTDLNLEFQGFILIQDTDVTDTKKKVMDLLSESETVDDIVSGVKDLFNLTENIESEDPLSEVGKTPKSLRPLTLADITEVFGQYLSNATYVKGNCVEFEIQSPITDFRSGDVETELMSQIRQYYSAWDSIEVSSKEINDIIASEVYPIADPSLYLKVGDDYVNVLPQDIQAQVNGEFINLFQAGPNIPRLVVNDGVSQVDLTLSTLKLLTDEGLMPVAGIKYKSASTGVIGSEIYFKDSNGSFQVVSGLSKKIKFQTNYYLSKGNEPCYNVTIEDLPVSNFGLV